MKYFGKKSLSSLLSNILNISWYLVIVAAIAIAVIGAINLFTLSFGDPVTSQIAKGNFHLCIMDDTNMTKWEAFRNWPIAYKFIIIPYFITVVVVLLQIIKTSQQLFLNFKNNIVFANNNSLLALKISKMNIVFSIITFNFCLLVVSILMLILCEIIKNGTMLQEEHDFTV